MYFFRVIQILLRVFKYSGYDDDMQTVFRHPRAETAANAHSPLKGPGVSYNRHTLRHPRAEMAAAT